MASAVEAQNLNYWTYRAVPRDKFIWDHIHTHWFMYCCGCFALWLGWVASIETICPEKSKIFTLWTFPENVCQLFYSFSHLFYLFYQIHGEGLLESSVIAVDLPMNSCYFCQFLFYMFEAVLLVTQFKLAVSSSCMTLSVIWSNRLSPLACLACKSALYEICVAEPLGSICLMYSFCSFIFKS